MLLTDINSIILKINNIDVNVIINFKTLEKTSIHHIGVEEFFNKLYKEYVKKEDFENDLFFSTYMCNSVVDYILNCILDNTVKSYTLQICG